MLLPIVPSPVLRTEFTRAFLLHHKICPREFRANGDLVVAITDKSILGALADIAAIYGCPVTTESVPQWDVERLIERLTSDRTADTDLVEHPLSDDVADVRNLASQPPVIRYVNILLREASDSSASDVHLEPDANGLTVRFRIDGMLVDAHEPPAEIRHAVLSRIKLLAALDIAERRKPQDGRIRARLDARELDLRVSTIPTMHGESIVLRLLDHGGRAATLDELGMSAGTLREMNSLCLRANGIILVTGPTGSGKTTTLYGALRRRNAAIEKIITVEDPIEYELPGITQMPVHRTATVTFAAALRAILRHDPDVVMIGEMRDAETAEIAIQAAMTGHLVFSTLHTNDSIGAIARLIDLGIPAYAIAATIEGVVAQRLVRRICDACRIDVIPSPSSTPFETPGLRGDGVRGVGCAACRGTGYRGRIGLFELLRVEDALRDAIVGRAPASRLREIACDNGFTSMAIDGRDKISAGYTTIEEVERVIQS